MLSLGLFFDLNLFIPESDLSVCSFALKTGMLKVVLMKVWRLDVP